MTDVVTSDSNFGTIFDPVLAIVEWRPQPHELTPPPPSANPARLGPRGLIVVGRDGLDDEIPF
jgi:hypothetical protein